MYEVKINFKDEPCYFNDLHKYLSSINFSNLTNGDILHYITSSNECVFYDFEVTRINHDLKLVMLTAVK